MGVGHYTVLTLTVNHSKSINDTKTVNQHTCCFQYLSTIIEVLQVGLLFTIQQAKYHACVCLVLVRRTAQMHTHMHAHTRAYTITHTLVTLVEFGTALELSSPVLEKVAQQQ